MRDIFNNYFKISFASSILYLVFGLLLFFNPSGVIVTISVIIGAISMIFGIFEIIMYTKTNSRTALTLGAFSFVAGLILCLNTNILATIIPMIIGVALIMQGVKKLEFAASFKEKNNDSWLYLFIAAALTIIVGIILFINPILGAVVTTQIVGAFIAIYAIIDVIDNAVIKKKYDNVIKVIDEVK